MIKFRWFGTSLMSLRKLENLDTKIRKLDAGGGGGGRLHHSYGCLLPQPPPRLLIALFF